MERNTLTKLSGWIRDSAGRGPWLMLMELAGIAVVTLLAWLLAALVLALA